MALAFAVLDLTGSPTMLGIVVGLRSGMQLICLLGGGVIGDRLPRRTLLVYSALVSALSQLTIATLLMAHRASIPRLGFLAAINGLSSAFAFPSSAALTTQALPGALRRRANVISRLAMNGALTIGSALAGIMIASIGSGMVLALDGVSFLVAAGWFRLIRADAVRTQKGWRLMADLREGWVELAQNRWIQVIICGFMVINAAAVGVVQVIGPTLATRTFGRASWGLILATQPAGMLLGGVVALSQRPKKPLWSGLWWMLTVSAFILTLAARQPVWVSMAAGLAAGFGIEVFTVAWDTALQEHVSPARLARVYSYDAVGSFLAVPIGQTVVGPLLESVGLERATMLLWGLVTATLLAMIASRAVRQL